MVLGTHPCCCLAAEVLKQAGVGVALASVPGQKSIDRLVLVNPKFFELHQLTRDFKKMPELSPIHGLKFLSDDGVTSSEFVSPAVAGYVTSFQQLSVASRAQAKRAKVEVIESKSLEIAGADEAGVQITINGAHYRPKMLIVGGELSPEQGRALALPKVWDAGVLRRYTFIRLKGTKYFEHSDKQTIPMSLDLGGQLHWAWMLPGSDQVQLAVEQSMESVSEHDPKDLLARWMDVLVKHRVLKLGNKSPDLSGAESMDLPLRGALSQDGVANRALLIGPAGGFYTACAEDIYPNCWSALFAAAVAMKALKETHLQDALGAYRQTWGSTLGDYLRGPQDNLRFLLPLVYRNSVMTQRMGEAILCGESVVR